MSEALDQLKQHLETDNDFQAAYIKIAHEHLTPMLQDLQALAKTAGIEITADEIVAGMFQANAALSDADLTDVAGGGLWEAIGTGAACAGLAIFTLPTMLAAGSAVVCSAVGVVGTSEV